MARDGIGVADIAAGDGPKRPAEVDPGRAAGQADAIHAVNIGRAGAGQIERLQEIVPVPIIQRRDVSDLDPAGVVGFDDPCQRLVRPERVVQALGGVAAAPMDQQRRRAGDVGPAPHSDFEIGMLDPGHNGPLDRGDGPLGDGAALVALQCGAHHLRPDMHADQHRLFMRHVVVVDAPDRAKLAVAALFRRRARELPDQAEPVVSDHAQPGAALEELKPRGGPARLVLVVVEPEDRAKIIFG